MARKVEAVRHVTVAELPEKSVVTVQASPQSFGVGRGLMLVLAAILFVLGVFVSIFGLVAAVEGNAIGLYVGLGMLGSGILIIARMRRRHLSKRGYDIVVDREALTVGGRSYGLPDIADVRLTDSGGTIFFNGQSLLLDTARAGLAQQAHEIRGSELRIVYGDQSVQILVGLSYETGAAAARALVAEMRKFGWTADG